MSEETQVWDKEEFKVLQCEKVSAINGPAKIAVVIGAKDRETLEKKLKKEVHQLAEKVATQQALKKVGLMETGRVYAINKKKQVISPISNEEPLYWCIRMVFMEAI